MNNGPNVSDIATGLQNIQSLQPQMTNLPQQPDVHTGQLLEQQVIHQQPDIRTDQFLEQPVVHHPQILPQQVSLSSDNLSLFGHTFEKKHVYIIGAVIVLLAIYYIYNNYIDDNDSDEYTESDTDDELDNLDSNVYIPTIENVNKSDQVINKE